MLPSTEMHPVACLKPRAVLSKQQAVDIFRIAGVLRPDGTRGTKPTASSVAKRYGVSEKTIRDIWRGRTWYEETLPFDMNRQPKTMMKTGRPLGRKDSAPRKRKLEIRTQKMKQTESELTDSRSYSNSEGEEEIKTLAQFHQRLVTPNFAKKCSIIEQRTEYSNNHSVLMITLQGAPSRE